MFWVNEFVLEIEYFMDVIEAWFFVVRGKDFIYLFVNILILYFFKDKLIVGWVW